MARVNEEFIFQVASDAAVSGVETSFIVWAERHGIDPSETTEAVLALIEKIDVSIDGADGVDKATFAIYFLQLGYEIRRRQQEEGPTLAPDIKMRDYLMGIARNFVAAEADPDQRANKQTVLERFFNTAPGELTK